MSILLQINDLEMTYGSHVILSGASLTIAQKQKIAVIGRNGAGKSTLFRLIVGEEEPTAGEINIHSQTEIGYLTQHSPFEKDEKVMDYLLRASGREEWACAKIAAQFQIKNQHFQMVATGLAGGYQMRVKLSAILAREPNLLLLDEPTNYLDLSTQLLLERFLNKYRGAFLLISHDREFISKTCDQTLEVDQGKTCLFPQSLQEYLDFKQKNFQSIEKANQKILEEKARLQSFIDRFGAKASKATQAKSKQKQIDRLKTIEIAHPLSTTSIYIPKLENKKGNILTFEDLAIGYQDKLVAHKINFSIERGEKIAVVGDNGQGKTTLLKTIANELPQLSGKFKWAPNLKIGYYAQHTPSTLKSDLSILEYLKRSAPSDVSSQEILQMAGNFLFKNDSLKKSISVLSGGEKARLCLANILLQKNDVLLLDEPTNHLDFETVEALATALRETNVTTIFVSHNRTFVDTLATGIVEVKNGRASRYHHNYEDYVYHIKSVLEADLNSQSLDTIDQNPDNHQREAQEENRRQIKSLNNQIRKLESAISELEKQKSELEKWFELNYNSYSSEKSQALGKTLDEIGTCEVKWLDLQSQIEQLKSKT
jgi:ATP-binding cassette subfamily F protein 3